MSAVHEFNFHRLVGFRLETQDIYSQQFFQSEFSHHQVESSLPGPGVSLEWNHSPLPLKPPGQYSFHMHKLLARWFYQFEFNEDRIKIAAQGNRLALPMVHHMLVHPSLRYLCSYHGSLLLHGAAVVKNNRSLVLTGPGGAGKTTSSSILLDTGGPEWGLHADDYVFLDHAGLSYGYLTRSHLYSDILRWVEDLGARLTRREKFQLSLFGNIRRWSGSWVKWPVRLTPQRMWPDRQYSPQARVAGVLILERGQGDQLELNTLDSHQVPMESLLTMNFFEARHFIRLVKKHHPDSSEDWLDDWRARERTLLERMTRTIPFYRLTVPAKPSDFREIRSELVDVVGPILEAV